MAALASTILRLRWHRGQLMRFGCQGFVQSTWATVAEGASPE
jgi:hypothetical protein